MVSAIDHYDQMLAAHFTWMLGGDVRKLADGQTELFENLGLAELTGTAVDLGCGSGAQSLALAQIGFDPVLAVDTSRQLLDELGQHAADLPAIRPMEGDMRTALPEIAEPGGVTAIVCMGDTLPHLPAMTDIPVLLGHVARELDRDGHFVVTYRDLTVERIGTERFVLVRGDDNRVLTCFLEYQDEETVTVHDLLHIRDGGTWQLRVSSYPKLRIAPTWLAEQCRTVGLHVRHDAVGPTGMRILHAQKPK